jgi:prephenate dehydrogenase
MSVQLTIIGLGKIGSSVGLALSDETKQINRIGHDLNQDNAQEAKKLGAVDTLQRNLFKAVEGTDILLLAIPVDQVVETLDLVKNDLRPDTVILDTSPIKQATMNWVENNLPRNLHYVSMMPTLNAKLFNICETGTSAANKDMFKDSMMVIAAPQHTEADALTVATNLSVMLGAVPLYMDVLESDGLASGGHVIPQLMAAGLMNSLRKQPGWAESRKVAGDLFYHATLPLLKLDDKARLGESIILNQENALRQLDFLIQELLELRDAVQEKDFEMLHSSLNEARDERHLWLSRRKDNDWFASKAKADMPSAKDMFNQLFGMSRFSKKK